MTTKTISKELFKGLLKETLPVLENLYFLFDETIKVLLTKSLASYKEQGLTGKQAEAKATAGIDPALIMLRDSYQAKYFGMQQLIRADQYYRMLKIQTQALIDIDEVSFALDLVPLNLWKIIQKAQGKRRGNEKTFI